LIFFFLCFFFFVFSYLGRVPTKFDLKKECIGKDSQGRKEERKREKKRGGEGW